MSDSGEIHQNPDEEKNPSGFSDSGEIRQKLDGEKNPSGFFDSYAETTLKLDTGRCINCGHCLQVCPHAVFTPGKDHVNLARQASCMECGACALNCPVEAITVKSGVGCAWAMISAALKGKDLDSGGCSCGGDEGACCGSAKGEST